MQQGKNYVSVSEHTIENNLGISSSTVHLMKRFRESGEISAWKQQGRKTNIECPLTSDTSTGAAYKNAIVVELFWKPLAVNTLPHYVHL